MGTEIVQRVKKKKKIQSIPMEAFSLVGNMFNQLLTKKLFQKTVCLVLQYKTLECQLGTQGTI